MTKRTSKFLLGLLPLMVLTACYTTPSYAYGDLFVATSFNPAENYRYEVGVCKGETLTLRWNVGEGRNPKLIASPAQNVEPQLPSRVSNAGEVQVTFKDTVTISFTIEADQNFETERRIVAIPEGVCTGFPLELRGKYSGTLEQTLPQVASLPHDLEVYWEKSLGALLNLQGLTQARLLFCEALDAEDKLICSYESGQENLRLEGTVTSAGYAGTYQGVSVGQTYQAAVQGTFNFVKADVKP